MIALVKMSLKLLLRNKGFLFFLIVMPIISTLVLSLKTDYILQGKSDQRVVLELKDYSEKAIYAGDISDFIVKVYDGAKTELSEYLLKQMAEIGMFSVCRADVRGMTEEEIEEVARKDAFDDRAGMLVYLKEDFDDSVLEGAWEKGIKLYVVSEDERQELFITELTDLFGRMKQVQSIVGDDSAAILDTLVEIQQKMPEKKVVNIAGKDSVELTQKQFNQHTQIGYAFAIITLGFLFCGVCVAHSVIEEQNNKVFTRIMLTETNARDYFVSKFVIALLISLMQTAVLAICLSFIPGLDVGMKRITFYGIIFLLGLIFSTLSLLVGVILGDVMSSNFAVFTVWSISALLAGLYCPIDNAGKALKSLSYLMPQKWFMDAAKLLIVGDKSAYSMIICVTVAYLIVNISVGGVCLKIKRYE